MMVFLSYFFCQATDGYKSSTAVLRGLIWMLVSENPVLISHVQKRDDPKSRLLDKINTWDVLVDIFLDVLSDSALRPLYLVVDALDECQNGRPELLDLIVTTSALRIRWIISSRNRPEIENKFAKDGLIPLRLELHAESVSAAVKIYAQQNARKIAQRKSCSAETAAQITRYLSENAGDTFLWVALICRKLEKSYGYNALRNIHSIPTDLDALFDRLSKQIQDRCPADLHLYLEIIGSFSRKRKLELLSLPKLTQQCRLLICNSLLNDPDPGTEIKRIVLRKGDKELSLPTDVLIFWSRYFERSLSGQWTVPEYFTYDEDEISFDSLERVFRGFMLTGIYSSSNRDEREADYRVACYFLINKLELMLKDEAER